MCATTTKLDYLSPGKIQDRVRSFEEALFDEGTHHKIGFLCRCCCSCVSWFHLTMMLSPQAARMGTVLRCIGKSTPQLPPKRHPGAISISFGTSSRLGSRKQLGATLSSVESNNVPWIRSADNSISQVLHQKRWKSTAGVAAAESDGEDEALYGTTILKSSSKDTKSSSLPSSLDYAHAGHSAGAEYRAKLSSQNMSDPSVSSPSSPAETWRINLGRGIDNAWLTGPRNEEWFTGVTPGHGCPGTL
jgi:hypothetical protein